MKLKTLILVTACVALVGAAIGCGAKSDAGDNATSSVPKAGLNAPGPKQGKGQAMDTAVTAPPGTQTGTP